MQYALLIYENEQVYAEDGVMHDIIGKHMAFGQEIAGAMRSGAGLQGTQTATTVRTAGGQQTIHDGPFAETKEQLGGLYIVEASDLDAAIAIARKVPVARDGTIEVRPLIPMPE